MNSLYERHTLSHRHIRLLDLHAPSKADDDISGSLRTVSLDQKPNYVALSYTWGADSTAPLSMIYCSGTHIPITLNCVAALKTLQHYFQVRTIWIDAICINQNDSKEKGHQIPLMREVYGVAKRVFIWLGEGTSLSDQALEWLANETKLISPYTTFRMRGFPANTKPGELLKFLRLLPEYLSRTYLPKKELSYSPSAMQDLVSRDWFKRVWTIQELVMANDPLVVCGNKSIRWNYLSFGIITARNHPATKNNDVFTDAANSVSTAHSFWIDLYYKRDLAEANVRTWLRGPGLIATLFQRFLDLLERFRDMSRPHDILIAAIPVSRFCLGLRPLNSTLLLILIIFRLITSILTPPRLAQNLHWKDRFRMKLPDMLNMLRTRQATMPVDKVFALHGVFEELGLVLNPPDYRKSVSEVYFEFTCSLIYWHRSLEILLEAGPSIPGLPSWVPDWNQKKHRVFLGSMNATRGSTPSFEIVTGDVTDIKYDERNSLKHEMVSSNSQWKFPNNSLRKSDAPKLITRGMIVDHITHCTSPFLLDPEPDSDLENLKTFITLLSTLSSNEQEQPNPRVFATDSRFKVLHCNQSLSREREKQKARAFASFLRILKQNGGADKTSTSHVPQCLAELKKDTETYTYFKELCNALREKRGLFTTHNASLGSGMLSVEEGDVVALLAGLSAPIILRKHEGAEAYQVLGVAYIEGLMQGEKMWDEMKAQEIILV